MGSDAQENGFSYLETSNDNKCRGQTVCVTGAGGFIASWLVKELLHGGYVVRGTSRNPDDEKNAHLKDLEGAKERLSLMKADLLDYDSLVAVIKGCDGVFHLACPLTDDPVQVVDPAVKGTRNVLNACVEAGVRRMILTSTIGAVYMDPLRDPDVEIDENCWSCLDYCRNTKNWYCYGKTLAEMEARDHARETQLDLVVLNPSVVLGPLLQSTLNNSTMHIFKYLNGSVKTYRNSVQAYVDVRNVAQACILLYESPGASGRYICAESSLHRGDVVEFLAQMFPQYPIPIKCSDETFPRKKPYKFSNKKISDLGLVFIPIKQCLHETVVNLQNKGFI